MKLESEFNIISNFLCRIHESKNKQLIEARENKEYGDLDVDKEIEYIKIGTKELCDLIFDRALFFDREKYDALFSEVIEISKKIEGETIGNTDKLSYSEVLGFTSNSIDLFFNLGSYCYENKCYSNALNIFRFLSILDHKLYHYWFGLGATAQAVENYPEAIKAYRKAIENDAKSSPTPYLACAYCASKNNQNEIVHECLEKVSAISETSDGFQDIKQLVIESRNILK